MTGEEFEARVDAILAEHGPGHAAHRALDLLTNEVLFEMGGGFERGTRKWLAVIEGQHESGKPYPLRDSGSGAKREDAPKSAAEAVGPQSGGEAASPNPSRNQGLSQ